MKNYKAHLALLVVNIIYAISYGFSKDVLAIYIPPFAFILIRVLGATLLFWLLFLFTDKEKIALKDFGRIALCGLFGVATNQLLFFEGLKNTISINASIIMVGTPLIVLLLARILLKEKIKPLKALGVVIGLSSAILLILSKGASGGLSAYGDTLILLNACSYGIYLVLVKPLMKKYNPLTVIRWAFTFGLIIVIPFGMSQWQDIYWYFPPDILWKIVFIVLCMTFLSYLLTVYSLGKVSPTIVSAYIYLQPILASSIAIYQQKEILTTRTILLGLSIFIGVFLVSLPLKKTPLSTSKNIQH